MRDLKSLLDAGYVPVKGQRFYKSYSLKSSLEFVTFKMHGFDKGPVFKPDLHDDLTKYYLHPYFPNEPVYAVKILKAMPCFKTKNIYYLKEGVLEISGRIKFDEKLLYQYPTFFKPLYKKFHEDNDFINFY